MVNYTALVLEPTKKIGGQIIADARRRAYQELKRRYKKRGGKV